MLLCSVIIKYVIEKSLPGGLCSIAIRKRIMLGPSRLNACSCAIQDGLFTPA